MKHLDNYDGQEAPRVITETLIRRSGKTPQGFPVYRLVRSESIFEKVGGYWNDWDANLNIQDRGGIETAEDGAPQKSHHMLDRAVAEIRVQQTYSHLEEHGWILERWFPATYFGSPEAWFAHVVMVPDEKGAFTKPTNIPRWPDYPEHGKYLMVAGVFQSVPAMGFLEDFINHREIKMAEFPQDIEKHMKMRERQCVERDQKASLNAQRENVERIMAGIAPLNSSSLEAGRWRSRLFERAGEHSHIGS